MLGTTISSPNGHLCPRQSPRSPDGGVQPDPRHHFPPVSPPAALPPQPAGPFCSLDQEANSIARMRDAILEPYEAIPQANKVWRAGTGLADLQLSGKGLVY